MPGMFERFDAHVREQAARDAEQEIQERMWREHQGMLGRAGFARLLDLLQGGEPTREPIEQWMQRRQMPGMLQQRIDGRRPRPGPMRPRTLMNGGVRG
jgi:hypothetical protein